MPSKEAQKKWNKEHYAHINIATPKALAEEFKIACARNGVSVAGLLNSFMRSQLAFSDEPHKPKVVDAPSVDTRASRRKQLQAIIFALENIRDAEEAYLDRIPENLQSSVHADAAACSISTLQEAIDMLQDAY